jgi:preprotein translocase subunit SecF
MFIIKYKKIFFALAIILVGGSVAIITTKIIKNDVRLGVDFTGGSVLEVSYDTRPSLDAVKDKVLAIRPEAQIQSVGTNDIQVLTETIDEPTKATLISALSPNGSPATEKRFNTIGPSVGQELRAKAKLSIIIVSLAIVLFIAFAFRKVSRPISSWAYGIIAIVVLVHDVVVPAGFFALLGLQVDTLFVVGLLTILGVSINDTIVVFDRIRENLHINETKHVKEDFSHTVGKSLNQTFVRSIMTSTTVLIALAALYLYGPEATHNLAITMFLGMFFGTYSSIFIASPLLVVWNDFKQKRVIKA